ncbi:hypothetical protein FHR95_000893 [Halomonas fontilapidosi]|uniref:Uncharacterized protein n=1 Tax=Halomonas fontilapidosi TaxID=616675 RepID=A0A7W5DI29_9GAMM|nr:hypothetical protein [Halomonas fontilapidosi]MBB3183352.1 hypothetical protein [Halomonas fontilapidosi]
MPWKRIALIGLIGWGIFHFVIAPPAEQVATAIAEHHPLAAGEPLLSITEPPRQGDIDAASRRLPVEGHDVQVVPRATFELKARVLSVQDYRLGRDARLSPLDLALGWGPMAEDRVIEALEISQRNRWYYWRTDSRPPIPARAIALNSSNIHMLAGNATTLASLKRLEAGDRVTLRGHLVDIEGENWAWRTSTTRTDTGQGACEIMLVHSLMAY